MGLGIIGIIPARYASTRFPGKPLIDIGGKTMIQRVYDQAKKATLLSDVVVATDDVRIYEHVLSFCGKAIMTSEKHQSGTDRCAEVVEKIDYKVDAVINIQGDEPFIYPEQIDLVASAFNNNEVILATLIKKINQTADLISDTVMKVVVDKNNRAIYFSRNAIPYCRGKAIEEWLNNHTYYKHIGIYGYRTSTLKEITQLPPSSLELTESLEQLRWIENGYPIHVMLTDKESVSIDKSEDLEKVKDLY